MYLAPDSGQVASWKVAFLASN